MDCINVHQEQRPQDGRLWRHELREQRLMVRHRLPAPAREQEW